MFKHFSAFNKTLLKLFLLVAIVVMGVVFWSRRSEPYQMIHASRSGVWSKHAADLGNTNLSPAQRMKGSKAWEFKTRFPIYSSAVTDGRGTLFIGDGEWNGDGYTEGTLYALNTKTGREKWKVYLNAAILTTPAVAAENMIYFGTKRAIVCAVKSATGQVMWSFPTMPFIDDNIGSSPTLGTDGTVYVGSGKGYFFALDAWTGEVKWRFTAGEFISSSPCVSGNTVYFACNLPRDEGMFYALDTATGTVRWKHKVGSVRLASPMISPAGNVCIISNDEIYVWNAVSGALAWRYKIGADTYCDLACDKQGVIYVGTGDGRLIAIDASKGKELWSVWLGGMIKTPAITADGVLYAGSSDGSLYTVNLKSHQVISKLFIGGNICSTSCLDKDGSLYIGTTARKVVSFR